MTERRRFETHLWSDPCAYSWRSDSDKQCLVCSIMYTSIGTWALLTFAVYVDFRDAKGSTVYRRGTLNYDVAKFLRGRCTHDRRVLTGSYGAVVLSTDRVRGLVDWRSWRWVVVGQTDHKVVEAMLCVILSQAQHIISYTRRRKISLSCAQQ